MSQVDPATQHTPVPGSPVPPPSLEEQFRQLSATWKAETAFTSSSTEMINHPAYQKIIALGPVVVPFLLRELERDPDHWFAALRALTGADPVPVDQRGKLGQMAESWLRWAKEQGYRW